MSRTATILLLVAAVGLAVFAAIFIPLSGGGRQSGAALFTFDPGEVRVIKITNGDKIIELKKSEEGWVIGPDPVDRASVDAVRRLLDTARSTPVLDRINQGEIANKDQLSEYGLKRSSVQFDIKGDRDQPLLIGKDAADETRVYVRFEDSRDVYLIPDDLVRMVLSPAEDFRDRMPVRLRPDRVARIVIRRPVGEVELKREGGGWALVKPLSARASTAAVETFLDKLFRTRIEGFEPASDPASFGLSEPVAEVRAFGEGESVPETIRLGGISAAGSYFSQLLPRNVTVRLPAAIMDLLSVDPTTFRDPAIGRINLDIVDLIRISSPGKTFEIRRDGEQWKTGAGRVGGAAIQRLVDALAAARAAHYEPATSAVLEKAGLADPARVVGFYSVASENTPESPAGEQLISEFRMGKPQAELAVQTTGTPEVAFTDPSLLDAVSAEPSSWTAP